MLTDTDQAKPIASRAAKIASRYRKIAMIAFSEGESDFALYSAVAEAIDEVCMSGTSLADMHIERAAKEIARVELMRAGVRGGCLML